MLFDNELQQSIEAYIEQLLKANFVGLEQIVSEYAKKPEESKGDMSPDTTGGVTIQDLSNINTKHLENVA